MIKKKSLIIVTMVMFLALSQVVSAANDYSQYFSQSSIDAGANLGSLDDNFHISFPAKSYDNSINVYISDSAVEEIPNGTKISKVYSYYILSKAQPNNKFEIAIRFDSENVYSKNVWLFDFKKNQWHQLPTKVDLPGKLAIAITDYHYGKIVLLEDNPVQYSEIMTIYEDFGNNFRINSLQIESLDSLSIESYNTALYPQNYERLSDIYQYDIKSEDIIGEDFQIVFDYEISDWKMPTVFFWDKNLMTWQELETMASIDNNEIYVETSMPYSRLAVFMKPDVWAGESSWYRYKDCDCAASRDYPKGTELFITHLSTGKTATVVVNDYGPELWTERIIDFDSTVFEQFGSLRWGVTDVKIELVQ
jgi:hypothetical protein